MKELRKLGLQILPDDEGLKVNNLMNYAFFLTPVQKELLQTEEMGRLYTLRQLSFCYVLDFKSINMGHISATHSRLEHSIITADYVRYFFKEKNAWKYTPPQEFVELVALLHDTGHTACSHAFERDTKRSQEKQIENIIFGKTRNNGGLTVAEVLEKYDVDKRKVFEDITEKNENPETLLVSQFCDRLAYIIDDAHHSHEKVQLMNWKDGPIKAGQHILGSNLKMDEKELYVDLRNLTLSDGDLLEFEGLDDLEWLDCMANLCISRTQLFMNVYGSPSNSKCVTLARNAAQLGYEEKWLSDDDLFYLNDELLIKKFLQHDSTRDFAEQIKLRKLPDTALAVSLNEEDYKRLSPLKEKRDLRLEFEEKVGGLFDINPLAKFSIPKIGYVAKNKNGRLDEFSRLCSDIQSYKSMHDAWVTRRLVVYANKGQNPKKVAEKAVKELGLNTFEDDYISLRPFELND